MMGCKYPVVGAVLCLLGCYIHGAQADKYHPRTEPIPGEVVSSEYGEGLHKIPYADWENIGQQTLNDRLQHKRIEKKAKNVIFFIGDGMGISTQTMARIHKSQFEEITLDKVHLTWDHFIDAGLVKTYNSDAMVSDSAGTATAFNCGKKARSGVIGMDEFVVYSTDCGLYGPENNCKSALHYAMDDGKLAGIVTTARITHATPACGFAHSPNRNWEYDLGIPLAYRSSCEDISHQLIFQPKNQDIRVLLGGGRRHFFMNTEDDLEYTSSRGYRGDMNLIDEWKRIKSEAGYVEPEYKYVWNQTGFDAVNPENTKYLFGMFERTHMRYESERAQDTAGEPSLTEMVEKAIKILEKSENGYYLYVEAGRIDLAHHGNRVFQAATETLEMSNAVQKALDMSNEEDTLIVVSADHSHVVTLNGYPHIDSDLYGPVYNTGGSMSRGTDGLPFQAVSYANGPGADSHVGPNNTRRDLTNEPPEVYNDPRYEQDAMVPRSSESHGGEDVHMCAHGPMAHLFTGTVEQSYIPTAIMHAACIAPGPAGEHCNEAEVGSAMSTMPILNIRWMTIIVTILYQLY